jgi:uncharacterized cupin superfamily protein
MTHAHGLPAEVPATLNVLSGDADLPPLVQWPPFPEEDIISGNPNGHRGAVLYRDPTGRYSVGVWECPVAKFVEPYPGTEFGHVLAGRATHTNEQTGESVTVKAGDHFFIAFGSRVMWEVHEPFRKIYTMYEAEPDAERFY